MHPCADQAVTFAQQLEEEIRQKVGSIPEDLGDRGGEAAEGRGPNQDASEPNPTTGDGAAQRAHNGETNESSLRKEITEKDCEAEAVRNELQVPHDVFIGFPVFHPPLLS